MRRTSHCYDNPLDSENMLRTTIVCLIALVLQVAALPEYIENLDQELSSLPEEYQYLADEFISKRDANAYCCKNWQYINNDEVFTKIQTVAVPQTHTITIGYQDCEGNFNPTRPPVPIPNTSRAPFVIIGKTTPSPSGCTWTAVNKTETYMTTEYNVITYLVPNSHTYCAPEDYNCCSSYVMLNNNCVHESAVASLEYLMQLGLIGGIGKK